MISDSHRELHVSTLVLGFHCPGSMGAISKGTAAGNKKSGMTVLCPKRTTGVVNPWGVCGWGGRDHLACLCCLSLRLIMEDNRYKINQGTDTP